MRHYNRFSHNILKHWWSIALQSQRAQERGYFFLTFKRFTQQQLKLIAPPLPLLTAGQDFYLLTRPFPEMQFLCGDRQGSENKVLAQLKKAVEI